MTVDGLDMDGVCGGVHPVEGATAPCVFAWEPDSRATELCVRAKKVTNNAVATYCARNSCVFILQDCLVPCPHSAQTCQPLRQLGLQI